VLSIPTVILFADGEVQQRVVGIRPRDHFEEAFGPWLDTTA
jgi:thioredoxin-like negative regulator of GroEL